MNLLLNAESLRPPLTGIGNYTFHLLEQFVSGTLVDEVHCFTGSGWISGQEQHRLSSAIKAAGGLSPAGALDQAVGQLRKAVGTIPGTKRAYDAVMDRRFESTANSIPGAVYHETNYIMKPFAGPCVTTVHDLSHLRFPGFHPADVVARLDRLLPQTLARADMVITVSDLVRDELLQHYDIPDSRVRTVYEGVDKLYVPRSSEDVGDVLSRYGLHYKGYVLLVATLEPRKGIDVLLDAWAMLPEAMRREFPLVLTGSSGWRNDSIRDRMTNLIAGGTVHHLGYVPDEVLPALYSGAAVFSYPSVYEGFGLPVLDAMSSGVPVICRAGTSMAEFAEGACMLCETGEPEELATRLQGLLESEDERALWSQKGLAQSARFSWEQCARETADIYRMIS